MTIDDVDGVRERLARCADEHGLLSRADLRALLDDHARLARDPLWQRAYNEALRHHHEVEAERNAARAEVERLTRERDEYKACWLRDVEKGRAAEERLRAERVKASAAWSSGHVALVADRDRLAAALAEVREALRAVNPTCGECRGHGRLNHIEAGVHMPCGSCRRWHAARCLRALAATPADLAADRDARVRAAALRAAAERLDRGREWEGWGWGVKWLRAEAERIERGGR